MQAKLCDVFVCISSNKPENNIEFIGGRSVRKHHFSLNYNSARSNIRYYEGESYRLCIIGTPIIRDRINPEYIDQLAREQKLNEDSIKELNGSFLIILYYIKEKTLLLCSDRFGSVPFFYFIDQNSLFASISFSTLARFLNLQGKATLNREAFFEFLHFQRLFGDKTYDNKTKFLQSASILKYSEESGICSISKYWTPSFEKNYRSMDAAAEELAFLLKSSFQNYTSDDRKYGLLLSGGLDSRIILAASDKKLDCFTIGDFKNREFRTASKAASIMSFPHHFIPRSEEFYSEMCDSASWLGNAMNTYDHAHFFCLNKIAGKVDVMLHGHGMDYLFQGLYLPSYRVVFLGKKTLMYHTKDITQDIAAAVINELKYKLKSIDIGTMLQPKIMKQVKSSLYDSITVEVEARKKLGCENAYDIWDWLVLDNIARHYTKLNLQSISTNLEERTIAFDNRLLDFYYSLPIEYRLHAEVFKKALAKLNPKLGTLKNANLNIPASAGPRLSSLLHFYTLFWYKLGFKEKGPPAPEDRSWPNRDVTTKKWKSVKDKVYQLTTSEHLNSLELISKKKLQKVIDTHYGGFKSHSDILLSLITIDRWLKMVDPTYFGDGFEDDFIY